jgi:hypothetical protein
VVETFRCGLLLVGETGREWAWGQMTILIKPDLIFELCQFKLEKLPKLKSLFECLPEEPPKDSALISDMWIYLCELRRLAWSSDLAILAQKHNTLSARKEISHVWDRQIHRL